MTYVIPEPILTLVRAPMSERQRAAVARLDAEDFSNVVRLTTKELAKRDVTVDEQYCVRAVVALKQYYALAIFDPHNMHAISQVLDPFWHSHILDTVRYKVLCEDIGTFMHHSPFGVEDGMEHDELVAAVSRVYGYTREVLVRIFGEGNIDTTFYPTKLKNDKGSHCGCWAKVEYASISDAFPEVPELVPLKKRYGFDAQKELIRGQVDA